MGAMGVSAMLLTAVWIVASLSTADPTPAFIPGVTHDAGLVDVGRTLFRNSLVLALHAVACVAGFIAGSSLPLSAERRQGFARWIHEKARPVAFAWVIGVICFSLTTQAYILGSSGATLAGQLDISTAALVVTALPHAMLELTAVFLPLAAWTMASRVGAWEDLLAATFATVAIAIPALVVAAVWEAYVWPQLLIVASPLY